MPVDLLERNKHKIGNLLSPPLPAGCYIIPEKAVVKHTLKEKQKVIIEYLR